MREALHPAMLLMRRWCKKGEIVHKIWIAAVSVALLPVEAFAGKLPSEGDSGSPFTPSNHAMCSASLPSGQDVLRPYDSTSQKDRRIRVAKQDAPLNQYARNCLTLTRWSNYNIVDLAISLDGNGSGGVVTVKPAYTVRRLITYSNDLEHYRTSYHRLSGGVQVPTGDNSIASIYDFQKGRLNAAIGGIAGYEWGHSAKQAISETWADFDQAQKEAAQECGKDPATIAKVRQDNPGDAGKAGAPCSAAQFKTWMEQDHHRHGREHFGTILRPVWGYEAIPAAFAGVEAGYARSDIGYFPLTDPAHVGGVLIAALPGDFPEGKSQFRKPVYHVEIYAGGLLNTVEKGGWGWGLSLSAKYRRQSAVPTEGAEQTVCPVATGAYGTCAKANIALPYETRGVVLAAGLKVAAPRMGPISAPAASVKLSYAADIRQWAVEAPIYLLGGDKGATSGGLRLGCASKGQLDTGYTIKGKCQALLFIGQSFTLAGKL